MSDVRLQLAALIATKLGYTVGTDLFCGILPASPTKCLALLDIPSSRGIPSQIDAQTFYLRVSVRAATAADALTVANDCYSLLSTVGTNTEYDGTGLIQLSECLAYIWEYSSPVRQETTQTKEAIYGFEIAVTTKRK